MAFIPRTLSNGRVCCSWDYALCDACMAYHGISMLEYLTKQEQRFKIPPEVRSMAINDVVDAYTPHLAALRAAGSTPESQFAETYAADRQRTLDAERREMEARWASAPAPRMTAAQLAMYEPPDGYAIALARGAK